jgi:hypothetical protein
MSGQVPFGFEMGEPEDVAPMVTFLLGEKARHITGQTYSVNGGRIAVWNQPTEIRDMVKEGRWSVDEIADQLDDVVGQERMPMLQRAASRIAEGLSA